MWRFLRDRRFCSFKFRRQHPIGPYFADFCCLSAKVVIEIDGASHEARLEKDKTRDEFLEKEGFLVLRFRDVEILREEGVKQRILLTLTDRLSPALVKLGATRFAGTGSQRERAYNVERFLITTRSVSH